MYCLDTNIAVDILRGDVSIQEKLARIKLQKLSITIITVAELMKGAYLAQKPEAALSLVQKFIESVDVLPLSTRACLLFGQHQAQLNKKGTPVTDLDLLIASIASCERKVLITRDKNFKHIPEFQGEIW